ncbi:uncharacterized, partial [Tachysurus ichikawai]
PSLLSLVPALCCHGNGPADGTASLWDVGSGCCPIVNAEESRK